MIPSGSDATVFNASNKWSEVRIVLGVEKPVWTQPFTDDFSNGLDPALYRFSQLGGAPFTDNDGLHIRSYEAPPWEEVWHREGAVPTDPTLPFSITIEATFPQTDPVYDTGFFVYGLNGTWGVVSEPLRVIQHGSATFPNDAGKILSYPPGVIILPHIASDFVMVNDQSPHVWRVEWDPRITDRFKIFLDSVEIYSSAAGTRPYGIGYGIHWTAERDAEPLSGIQDLLVVHSVTVDEIDHEGFESPTHPSWSLPNNGGNLDTASDGERFTLDNTVWAKIPQEYIQDTRVDRGLSVDADTFSITLLGIPEWDYWKHRPILIDTRISSPSGSAHWIREIAGRVEKVYFQVSGKGIPTTTISGRSIPQRKLADTISASYVSAAGSAPGPNLNYSFPQIFQDIVDISDSLDGSPLGLTSTNIEVPDVIPLTLNSGATELGRVISEWADRLVQESWIKYDVSGAPRYGEITINLWDVIPGTAYALTDANVVSFIIDDDDRQGPGQVQHHPNLARLNPNGWYWWGKPDTALYPMFAYPPHSFTWGDTVAYGNAVTLGPLTAFPDRTGAPRMGGISKLRLYSEISRERRLQVNMVNHNWPEPTDAVSYGGETFIIDRVSTVINQRGHQVTLECFSTDIIGIMTR